MAYNYDIPFHVDLKDRVALVTGGNGGIGGMFGMHVFHHKTRHWYFAVFFPLIAIAQIALCAWLVIKF